MHTLGLTQALNTVASYGTKALQANKLAEEKKAAEEESRRRFDIKAAQNDRLLATKERKNEIEKLKVNTANREMRLKERQQEHDFEYDEKNYKLREQESKALTHNREADAELKEVKSEQIRTENTLRMMGGAK